MARTPVADRTAAGLTPPGSADRPGRTTIHVNEFGDGADWQEILSSFFGNGQAFQSGRRVQRSPEPLRGQDIEAELTVSFMEAVHGAKRMIAVNDRKIRVSIPIGNRRRRADYGWRVRDNRACMARRMVIYLSRCV